MSNFKLSLPTDIPWKRICVTEDMIDKAVCDNYLPAKWQTSMAVFKYKPEEDYQDYPDYNITYLKVTATITGYQPMDQEIQGQIDWDGVDVSTIPGLTDLLNSYNPCHGAILQVAVGPKKDSKKVPIDQYPFFLDFEPKKRELYEMATDTQEKLSRSIESLNITNSAGATQSTEVLDIDMGGGGVGMNASYAGTGGGFNYNAPSGQWGTRRLNADESLASRSSDVGQEKRETFSHTTQLSQMYHLLDSYHLGTNRVVFFVQPRPHTLEEPSGFVRGPRPVEGIQEYFMVVAQPKDQKDFCVSLRLDTSHLTKTPIMEYDYRTMTTGVVSASVPTAFSYDDIIAHFTVGNKITGRRACLPWPAGNTCWNVPYQCYVAQDTNTETINAPIGYIIESYDNIVNESDHGNSNVFISDDLKSATISVEANGQICLETGEAVCLDCPDAINYYFGNARRQVSFNLRSVEPVIEAGEEEVLMITTRGLCCCTDENKKGSLNDYVLDIKRIPRELAMPEYSYERVRPDKSSVRTDGKESQVQKTKKDHDCNCHDKTDYEKIDSRTRIRKANELGSWIKTEGIRSLNNPMAKPQKYQNTDFFNKQLEYKLIQSKKGREILDKSVAGILGKEASLKIGKSLDKTWNTITRKDLLNMRETEISKITGFKQEQIAQMKMKSMGVKFKSKPEVKTKSKKKGDTDADPQK